MLILSRDTGERNHALFGDIGRFLRPRSLLVVNDTRVIPARLYGTKPSGGRVEVLLVEPIPEATSVGQGEGSQTSWREVWRALARGLGRQPPGARLRFGDDLEAEIVGRGERGEVELGFSGQGQAGLLAHLEDIGSIPLPPYIEAARKEQGTQVQTPDDKLRYQTV